MCYLNELIVWVLPKADTPILQDAPSSATSSNIVYREREAHD